MVFGAPCSGKTTFCKKFSERFGTPFYDLTELKEQHRFTRKNILLVLNMLAQTGKNILVEGELDSEAKRAEIRRIFVKAGYNPSLVWIQTDMNTIKARLKMRLRSAAKAKDLYETKVEKMEAPAEFEKAIILSGKHTFQTQMNHVLSQLN